jgi:hypothetical protein
MKELSQNWVVMKVTQRPSIYGNEIYEITFANTNNQIAHTYVDESNQNFRRWRDIIQGYDEGFGIVVNGLKIKKTGRHRKTGEPLVNADSLVKVVHCEDNIQTILDQFVEELASTVETNYVV